MCIYMHVHPCMHAGAPAPDWAPREQCRVVRTLRLLRLRSSPRHASSSRQTCSCRSRAASYRHRSRASRGTASSRHRARASRAAASSHHRAYECR